VEAPRPLPLAVFVYPGGIPPTGEVHRFVPEIDMVVSAHLLAARGFAVLRPDMPWPAEPRHSPLRAIASLVLPAVDAAVAAGWADAGRVAAVGQSYGGYAVLALLVGTDRFRAGVASSPVADLISFYGEGRLRPGGVVEPSWQDWAESGQGEMGAPPWEQPERYVANSPVFHLPRVGAPLLLLAGGRSPADLRQSVEVFCGLRRLGKTAELVTYAGGRHLPHAAEARSFRDAADRVCGWLDMHLR
jgi:dipeptidyl aminopeptidase/acylaminoacyl peptidase